MITTSNKATNPKQLGRHKNLISSAAEFHQFKCLVSTNGCMIKQESMVYTRNNNKKSNKTFSECPDVM
jgi:hypothetical protein